MADDRTTAEPAHADRTTVPRLVTDGSRSLLALGLGFVLAFALQVLLGFLDTYDPDDEADAHVIQVIGLLATYVGVFVVYQAVTWWRLRAVDSTTLADWARATTPHTRAARLRGALLGFGGRTWSITAAATALGAVLVVSLDDDVRRDPFVLSLSLALVVLAWSNVVVASAVSYLRLHADEPGLELPGAAEPTWSDLVYLAVQVSTTFSSSDVTIVSRPMRRLVTLQSLVAFVFNTVIVALLVSSLLTLAD